MISNETFLFGLDKQGQSPFVEFPSLFFWTVESSLSQGCSRYKLAAPNPRGIVQTLHERMKEKEKEKIFPA